MTYSEATRLTAKINEQLHNDPLCGAPDELEIDENDETIFINGCMSFGNLKWLAAQLPVVDNKEEVTSETK